MLPFRGTCFMSLVCLLPASATGGEKDKLSSLSKITVTEKKDDVQVTLLGTRAPDFTSFTTSNPFGVVVDWAGSKIEGVSPELKFARGLIRQVKTKQYDSEAERISRVTIELSRETSYHVEAAGPRVIIHFQPVADPIPEPQPEPERIATKEQPKEPVYVSDGPLTEPDLPVPQNPPPPPVVAKVEPPKPAPKPVMVAKVEAKKEEPKVVAPPPKEEPKVVAPPPKKEEPKVVAPLLKEEPKAEPVVAKVEPKNAEPVKKDEPRPIASYTPKPRDEAVRVMTPTPSAVRNTPPERTNQIASNSWTPPGAGRVRGLPVIRYGKGLRVAEDTIQIDGETPVDPDEPDTEKPSSGVDNGDNDFDPGPRLMKYIGFRQMADVSRVFVRLDGKPKYRSKREGDTVVVELIDTSVPLKNNTRPLDTSYFNSPVSNVQAVPSGGRTRIEVKLKEQVPFQVKRIGTTIAIDFTRR